MNLLALSYTTGLINVLYILLRKGVEHGSMNYILRLRVEHLYLVEEDDNSGVT